MSLLFSGLKPLRWALPLVGLLVAAALLPDAAAQGRRKVACRTCRDARFLPCEEHAVAAAFCGKYGFYCSECARSLACCHGRGLNPCPDCVEEGWKSIRDPGFETFKKAVEHRRPLIAAMQADPMFVLTEHFILMSTMEGLKFSPGEVAEMAGEMDVLKEAFPWLFRNPLRLSAHAMLHLYALRLERIYARYCAALGMTVQEDRGVRYGGGRTEVFLAGPVKHKTAWAARHGGAMLVSGSSGKFILAQKDVGTGGRNRKFYGPNLSGDRNFHDGVIHMTARCLLERYYCSGTGKFPPGWLKVGFPHWMEWAMLEQCSYYLVNIEIQGLGQAWITKGWDKRAVSIARSSDAISFPLLSKKDFADLGFNEHLLSWSYVNYLLGREPREKFRAYLDQLRRRVPPRDALMQAYGYSELTLEDQWRASLLGGALDEMTAAERFLGEFDRSRGDPDLETRASTAYYLKFNGTIAAAERILLAFQDDEVLVRASAQDALMAFADEAAVLWAVEHGLTHANPEVRRNTAIAMGSFPEMADVSVPLLMKLFDDGRASVRAGAVRGLGELHPEEGYVPIAACVDDPDPEVRVEAALALWNYRRDDALTQVLKLLRDPVWAVRLAAIRALHHIHDKRVISALIDQLGKEGGRLREDLHDLLVQQTHVDFQLNAERWLRWWNETHESFTFKTVIRHTYLKRKYAVQYHDVDTCSKKFIFLLDLSSSMNAMVDVKKVAGRTYGPGDLRKKKIDVAKTELVRLLRTFDKNMLFNIITFSEKTATWKKNVTAASKGVVKQAEKYVWELKVPSRSATNIYDALNAAFDMVDAGFAKRKYESIVDTMFLLSDGKPTAGAVTDVDMILRTIEERNRIHGIKIHTFALGGAADAFFLKRLAKITGGEFQVIRVH